MEGDCTTVSKREKNSKQLELPSVGEWLNKIWYMYSVALKKNEDKWLILIRKDAQSFFFFLIYLLINLFIFGCVGSSFLCEGFPQLRQVGATLHRGARASHCRSLSRCGAQAPDAQAQ